MDDEAKQLLRDIHGVLVEIRDEMRESQKNASAGVNAAMDNVFKMFGGLRGPVMPKREGG